MITFEVPREVSTREIGEWCKESCTGKYLVKNPPRGYQMRDKGLKRISLLPLGPYSVKFWNEDDAVLFKMAWL